MTAAAYALFAAIGAAAAATLWQHPPPVPFDPDLVRVAMDGERPRSMVVGRHEVTIAEWRRCFKEGACGYSPMAGRGVTGDNFPVTGVNVFDVNEYVAWARGRSGLPLRLPTLDEWNSIAREISHEKRPKLFDDPRLAWAADYGTTSATLPRLKSSGSFGATREGVADLNGNVWEWTATCASPGFEGEEAARCPAFIAVGEHEAAVSIFIRDPAVGGCATGTPPQHLGLRLVADN